MNETDFNIVLAGNPNCGKTAVFNALTGLRTRVGNWPGVTVEKKLGHFHHKNCHVTVIDLPGVYSVHTASDASAIDEKIACQYLQSGEVNAIVNVLDANNLERNLYLTLQLLEMNIPTILAVNMLDVAQKRGVKIDLEKLSQLLDCPVVGLVASQQIGITELKNAVVQVKSNLCTRSASSQSLRGVRDEATQKHGWIASSRTPRNDGNTKGSSHVDDTSDVDIASARYARIGQIIQQVRLRVIAPRKTFTERLDQVVLNRYLGVPIFLFVMYLMFVFAINVGGAFQDFFDISSATLFVDGTAKLLAWWHLPPWVIALIANGVGKGINTTLTFVPVIGGMFLFLSFLEDSGYMARAAFVMDRLMRALGLPGKSFVPMIVGFGCNVPAVMGARTLENPRDRILTVMMMPFMSCGARLAIFAVFASAFFPRHGAEIIFVLYLTGILVAMLTGLVLRKTVLPGKPAPLVMELPPYHTPRIGALCRHMWYRLKSFVGRASRVIIPVCVILGAFNSITLSGKTLLSIVGRSVTPIFAPMGIEQNNWPAVVGLTTGILAKEVVVGTLNTLYDPALPAAAENFNFWGALHDAVVSIPENLRHLGDAFKNPIEASIAPHEMNKTAYGEMYQAFGSTIAAFAYLLFVLLYFPCVSTMAAMHREIGGAWALFSVLWSTGLAYALAVIGYQLLSIAGHPITSCLWVLVWGSILAGAIFVMRRYASRMPVVREKAEADGCGSNLPVGRGCGSRCQGCKIGQIDQSDPSVVK